MKRLYAILAIALVTSIAWPAGLVLAGGLIVVWLGRRVARLARRFIIWML